VREKETERRVTEITRDEKGKAVETLGEAKLRGTVIGA